MKVRKKPLYLMAEAEGTGEGPEGAGAGLPPKSSQPADEKVADDGKTFTQADVERIIAGRFSKYADYDQLKQQVTELAPLREQFDTIAKAFGAKADEPADPAVLAEQVTQEQAKAREAAVQLAVYRNAAAAGANPDALLDSASFLRTLAEVDPTDPAAVTAAITAATETNPRLKAVTEDPFPSAGQAGIGVSGGGATHGDPRSADLAQIEADLRAAKRP
jgi:hypothetical protein